MRHLLNTLFVLTEDAYLSLKDENVVINQNDRILGQIPLITLENIVYFGYKGASPALMGACTKRSVGLCFLTPRGRLLARISGESRGNVLLRRKQYRLADDEEGSLSLARNFITGKLFNSKVILSRGLRDHRMSVDEKKFTDTIHDFSTSINCARAAKDKDTLRGIEGNAAHQYFSVLGELILRNRESFPFYERVKRPPEGRVNAMLSFAYTLLAHDCASALESVGLDAYVGFLHTDRSGRVSLALDLMEELRSSIVDRFVLSLINREMIKPDHFTASENNVFRFTDDAKRKFLTAWQEKKKEEIRHPFLEEKIPWGLVPYTQALLLARYIRGDLNGYPAFLWK